MTYTLLTIHFLDNTTTDENILAVYEKYKGKGESLGEISIKTLENLKLLKLVPCESYTAKFSSPLKMRGLEIEEERGQTLSINDFTTELVSKFKIEYIMAENIREEEKTETETTAIEGKTETTEGANETESI